MSVPFNKVETDDETINRIQTEIAASFEQAAPTGPAANVATTERNIDIDSETAVIVLPTTSANITIGLPVDGKARQCVIINRSSYDAVPKTADAKFVFPAVAKGTSATVASDGADWFSTSGAAK